MPLIFLGLIQALTEFFPISSSGHLNLAQKFLGLAPSLSLDVFLNTATLCSVIFFFRRQLPDFIRNLPLIIVATVPAASAGLLFDFDHYFSRPQLLPYFFLITSTFLFCLKFINIKNQTLTYSKALIIGLFQALALFPGISRSASTIFAALLLGLSPAAAFQFSFFLFIPASLGALLLNFNNFSYSPSLVPSFLLTFIIGLFCLYILRQLTLSRRLWLFGFYTLSISLIQFLI